MDLAMDKITAETEEKMYILYVHLWYWDVLKSDVLRTDSQSFFRETDVEGLISIFECAIDDEACSK